MAQDFGRRASFALEQTDLKYSQNTWVEIMMELTANHSYLFTEAGSRPGSLLGLLPKHWILTMDGTSQGQSRH